MDSARIKNILINFIVPLIALATIGVLLFVVLIPAVKKMPTLAAEEASKTELRNTLKDKQAKLNRLVDFKSILEENSGLVDRVMPVEGSVPGLLDEVNKIANESGLEVLRLNYSFNSGSDPEITDANSTGYDTVLVSLGADGTYPQMIAFLKGVENAARIVEVVNFRFDGASHEDDNTLSFTFTLSAPYMSVQSTAVTDEPLTLDISSNDFVSFINKVKALRYYEKSAGEASTLSVTAEETTESTSSE
jgi:Tfp pilus assembly protein PilO